MTEGRKVVKKYQFNGMFYGALIGLIIGVYMTVSMTEPKELDMYLLVENLVYSILIFGFVGWIFFDILCSGSFSSPGGSDGGSGDSGGSD